MDINELGTLGKHGVSFMKKIDLMVTCVKADDEDNLVALIHEITISHDKKGIRNAWEFEIVCEILISYFKEAMESEFTSDAEDAWKKFFEFLVSTVDEKLFELKG